MHLKLHLFPYPSNETCVLGAQKNSLIEAVSSEQVIQNFTFNIVKIKGKLGVGGSLSQDVSNECLI